MGGQGVGSKGAGNHMSEGEKRFKMSSWSQWYSVIDKGWDAEINKNSHSHPGVCVWVVPKART